LENRSQRSSFPETAETDKQCHGARDPQAAFHGFEDTHPLFRRSIFFWQNNGRHHADPANPDHDAQNVQNAHDGEIIHGQLGLPSAGATRSPASSDSSRFDECARAVLILSVVLRQI
jgi:hypothetical protein